MDNKQLFIELILESNNYKAKRTISIAAMYIKDAIKIPLHKLNLPNKLNKKKTGKLRNTQFLIKEGNVDS